MTRCAATKPVFQITLESRPDPVPEIVRLRRLLKLSWRAFGFRCVRVEEINSNADTLAESAPAKQEKL